ncbi:hypothetical protein AHMF7605_10115 [Adhaeribacter arboris]|uniref:Uncharacterized protein n=1 Tax=Adhaeribacter arboris TaxID=2072846 RepID=A0A2T2YEA6_9BACT|nr:hypothetical protein AHMF7605_10115 [Adhaeribacter arboris]
MGMFFYALKLSQRLDKNVPNYAELNKLIESTYSDYTILKDDLHYISLVLIVIVLRLLFTYNHLNKEYKI